MADDVEVDILFNTKQAQKSLDRLEKSFSDFSQTATKETKKASSAMDTFKGVLGAQSLVAGFGLLKNAASGLFNVFITDGSSTATGSILVDDTNPHMIHFEFRNSTPNKKCI